MLINPKIKYMDLRLRPYTGVECKVCDIVHYPFYTIDSTPLQEHKKLKFYDDLYYSQSFSRRFPMRERIELLALVVVHYSKFSFIIKGGEYIDTLHLFDEWGFYKKEKKSLPEGFSSYLLTDECDLDRDSLCDASFEFSVRTFTVTDFESFKRIYYSVCGKKLPVDEVNSILGRNNLVDMLLQDCSFDAILDYAQSCILIRARS